MKDHEISNLVNELRNIAVKYGGTEQLRARVAECITPHLQQLQAVQEENRVLQKQLGERWLETAALKSTLERECDDTDAALKILGVNPEEVRTDSGALNLPKITVRARGKS